MILQTDPRLRKEVNEWYCYIMDMFWFANKYGRLAVSPEMINASYERYLYQKWIDIEAAVQNPEAIFRDMGLIVKYHDRHDPSDYICKATEFEILYFERQAKEKLFTHFTAGDGAGHVTYDSMGCAMTVRYGRLVSKRIFKLINGWVC